MASSTWSWIGGTGAATVAANWTLVTGSGNASGVPNTGDTVLVPSGMPLFADLKLNGNIIDVSGNAGATFVNTTTDATNSSIDSASVIDETGNGTLAIQGPFLSQGTIEVTGAGSSLAIVATAGTAAPALLTLGQVVVDQGDNLTITGGTVVSADIQVNGGSADVAGTINGPIYATIGVGGTLELNQIGTAATENITFAPDFNVGTSELLQLEDPAAFTGIIEDFGPLDTIDLGPVSISTIVFAGTLNVGEIIAIGTNGATVFTAFQTQLADVLTGFAQNGTFVLSGSSGFAGDLRVTQGDGGDTVLTSVGPSTWLWSNGATGAFDNASDWTFAGGSGNGFGYPQPIGDTGIDAGGTIDVDVHLGNETLALGGTSSVAELAFSNFVPINFPAPTINGSVIDSAVPGNTTAETTVLAFNGDNSNYGTITADGPAGSTFTIAIGATNAGTLLWPGYFSNFATIQADTGNTLFINIGSSSALFNVGTIIADGGTVVVNASASALAGGFMPVRGFYDIEGGGTIITADYLPASDGNNGAHESYEFTDSTPGNTLKIGNIGSFGGAIIDFAAGDTIDLGTSLSVGTITYSTATSLLVLENASGVTRDTLLVTNDGTGFASGTFAVAGGSADGFNFSTGADGDTVITTSNALIESSGTSGAWQSASTWANGIVPGSTASPTIGLGATAPFTVNTGSTAASVGGLDVESPFATIDVTSNLTLTTGQLADFAGTIDVAAGNTISAAAIQLYAPQTALTLAAAATLDLAGRLNDDLEPINGTWSLQPGQNPYALGVNGTAVIDGALLAGPTETTRGGNVSIGYDSDGSASVFVNPGATVTDTHTTIGSDPTSSGTLVVDDANYTDIIDNADTFNSRGNMTVGDDDIDPNLPTGVTLQPPQGAAQLVIENNATVTDSRAYIAFNEASEGTVTVSSGGMWNVGLANGGVMQVGDGGQGALIIESGGTVNVGNTGTFTTNGSPATGGGIGIGFSGGSGTVTVESGGVLQDAGGIAVGHGGPGTLYVQNGGTVDLTANGLGAGSEPGGAGTVIVSGTTSVVTLGSATNGIGVGIAAQGFMEVMSGATVSIASVGEGIGVGQTSSVSGTLVVSGGTITLGAATGGIGVGLSGSGTVEVQNGGTIASSGNGVFIGQNGGTGTVLVSGTGSAIDLSGSGSSAGIGVGVSSFGSLDVSGGGQVNTGTNFIDIGDGGATGILTVENGGTLVGGNLAIGHGGTAFATIDAGGTVNATNVTISQNGSLVVAGGLVDPASMTLNSGGAISGYGTLDASLSNASTVTASGGTLEVTHSITSNGTLAVSSGSGLTLDRAVGSGQFVDFLANTGTLVIGNIGGFQATVSQFGGADAIVVQTTPGATFSQNGSLVSVISNGSTLGEITFGSSSLASYATATPGALQAEAICFVRGTRIATPKGDVPVEKLAVGDRVTTLRGAVRPIVWIGEGRVLATRGRRSAATPVIVRKGAFGDNVPHCDLHVTKGHALYMNDVLIPVEFLVNHRSIYWDDRAQEVFVYHIELETHDVLLANGAPAESYRDDGNRWLFQNANTGWELPPKPPCAPVLTGGPVVDAAWRQLLDRAGPRTGLRLTDDPDLHLLVEGQRVDAIAQRGTAWIFPLAARHGPVRIVSRAGAPAELGTARDPRTLGVAVRQVVVREGARFHIMEAADAALTDGFHEFEPDIGQRWTDGDAGLPAVLFRNQKGPAELVLHLGGTTQYPLHGSSAGRVAA